MTDTYLGYQNLIDSFLNLYDAIEVREDVANLCVSGVCQNSLRGIDSHGIRLFPHYIQAFLEGRLNKNPSYVFNNTSDSITIMDADHAPGHAAGIEAVKRAILQARKNGISAVSVSNSSHFGAAAYYGLEIANNDMIGLSFTNATAHVPPFKGSVPFFGNNPVCMCAPILDEEPFCLDMATTTTTFNSVQKCKAEGIAIPQGWCSDSSGRSTTNPADAYSLLPIGDYKGFGLSMMVDILCGVLSNMPFGPDVTPMFNSDLSSKRKLGHFFIAININSFLSIDDFKRRMKDLAQNLREQPSIDQDFPVQCPGDPEKTQKVKRLKNGIPTNPKTFKELNQLLIKYSLEPLKPL